MSEKRLELVRGWSLGLRRYRCRTMIGTGIFLKPRKWRAKEKASPLFLRVDCRRRPLDFGAFSFANSAP